MCGWSQWRWPGWPSGWRTNIHETLWRRQSLCLHQQRVCEKNSLLSLNLFLNKSYVYYMTFFKILLLYVIDWLHSFSIFNLFLYIMSGHVYGLQVFEHFFGLAHPMFYASFIHLFVEWLIKLFLHSLSWIPWNSWSWVPILQELDLELLLWIFMTSTMTISMVSERLNLSLRKNVILNVSLILCFMHLHLFLYMWTCFSDIAIGAPYEATSGVVYIYNGAKTGLQQKFSQRIVGSSLDNNLRTFGYSISRPWDVDRNSYAGLITWFTVCNRWFHCWNERNKSSKQMVTF